MIICRRPLPYIEYSRAFVRSCPGKDQHKELPVGHDGAESCSGSPWRMRSTVYVVALGSFLSAARHPYETELGAARQGYPRRPRRDASPWPLTTSALWPCAFFYLRATSPPKTPRSGGAPRREHLDDGGDADGRRSVVIDRGIG
ncbi:hypothetical protein NHJ13734_008021 [Beauveria thailandica]